MFDICLFDLDQTLLDTDDMKDLREAGKNVSSQTYVKEVSKAFAAKPNRRIYKPEVLAAIRAKFPSLKLGVFTRAPQSYTSTLLNAAYPGFNWDVVVAYENVKRTKPFGDGIDVAMKAFKVEYLDRVVLVGDGDMDVRAAYNAGCVVALDRSAWPYKWLPDHWRALGHIPDAIIQKPEDLLDVLDDYRKFLPDLEWRLSEAGERASLPRFDKVNKFIPREAGGDNTAYPIYACGRSFSGYESLKYRRQWHDLTQSIHANKESEVFPDEWIAAVRQFIFSHYNGLRLFGGDLRITVVPHRPGRMPRLEAFLAQLKTSCEEKPIKGKLNVHFHPTMLSYKNGVKSNSNDKLNAIERFENVRDHLYVLEPAVAKHSHVLVIDDVCTTGSTLIYANQYLKNAGASSVALLSIAMNVSNVLYD
jgi:HAD superfamily hydrolase (TIGR01509 family)